MLVVHRARHLAVRQIRGSATPRSEANCRLQRLVDTLQHQARRHLCAGMGKLAADLRRAVLVDEATSDPTAAVLGSVEAGAARA